MAFGWDDAAKIAAPVLGLAAGIGAGKRQIKQQKKLNELGIEAYRQQREIDQANQKEMWNATNIPKECIKFNAFSFEKMSVVSSLYKALTSLDEYTYIAVCVSIY